MGLKKKKGKFPVCPSKTPKYLILFLLSPFNYLTFYLIILKIKLTNIPSKFNGHVHYFLISSSSLHRIHLYTLFLFLFHVNITFSSNSTDIQRLPTNMFKNLLTTTNKKIQRGTSPLEKDTITIWKSIASLRR